MKRLFPILLFACALTGCTTTQTFDVSVKNQTSRPVTVGFVKEGPPFEAHWASPEDYASLPPSRQPARWGQVIPEDKIGAATQRLLKDAGHVTAAYPICRDDPKQLQPLLSGCLADAGVECILTNGGTGISRRDQTIQVIEEFLTSPLPGFGELFRM